MFKTAMGAVADNTAAVMGRRNFMKLGSVAVASAGLKKVDDLGRALAQVPGGSNSKKPGVSNLSGTDLQDVKALYAKAGDPEMKKPMIAEFSADWCPPCQPIVKALHELEDDKEFNDKFTVAALFIDGDKLKINGEDFEKTKFKSSLFGDFNNLANKTNGTQIPGLMLVYKSAKDGKVKYMDYSNYVRKDGAYDVKAIQKNIKNIEFFADDSHKS